MDIAFRARNVEVPDSLRRVTLQRVTRLAERYGIERALICFSEERNPRIAERQRCEVTLFGQGGILRVQTSATEAAVAAERVLVRVQHRASRLWPRRRYDRQPYERRYGSVHFPPHRPPASSHLDRAVDRDDINGGGVPAGEMIDVITKDGRNEPMTPEEAALQMAGRDGDIYFFINAETSRTAAVYRRLDGNVGLIGPSGGLR